MISVGLYILVSLFGVLLSCSFTAHADESSDCDIFILAGQSNMDGRGDKKALLDAYPELSVEQDQVDIYYANPAYTTNYLQPVYQTGWQKLMPGLSVPPKYTNGLPSDKFGPELSFARKIVSKNLGRRLAIIKVSQGNTSLSKDWNPNNGRVYLTFTNTVEKACSKLAAAGVKYDLRAVIWHQGESDVSGGAEKYEKNLSQLIKSIRRDLGADKLPFVVGEISTNKDASFRSVQQRVADQTPNSYFVTADGLHTVEGTHFDSRAVITLGERFADVAIKIINSEDKTKPLHSSTISPPEGGGSPSTKIARVVTKDKL